MTLGASSGIVFTWLSNFVATAGLIGWFSIALTYLRFYEGMKAQGIDRRGLPYASRLQPFAAWYSLCGTAFVLFVRISLPSPFLFFSWFRLTLEQFNAWQVFLNGHWSAATFVTHYLPIMFFPVLYILARLAMRVRPIKPHEMDFVSDVAEFEAMTYVSSPLCCHSRFSTSPENRHEDPPPRNKIHALWMWLVRIPTFPQSLTLALTPSLFCSRCDPELIKFMYTTYTCTT